MATVQAASIAPGESAPTSFGPDGGGGRAAPERAYLSPAGVVWPRVRILSALACIVLMSVADLKMTLAHVTSVGMVEENPIARFLMLYGGVWSVIAWKVCTVWIGVWLLWRLRAHRSAELGAWFGAIALSLLCVHWSRYNAQVSSLTPEILALHHARAQGEWVVLTPATSDPAVP